MKKLITETEKNKIKKMNNINENWFEDVMKQFKATDAFDAIKKKFKEITGVDYSEKETSGKVTKDYQKYKIEEPEDRDIKFYKKILDELDAPVTKENLAFFYAWRQAEGAKAAFNPFNTTQSKEGSTLWNCLKKKDGKCSAGVRNYKTENDGVEATVKTLTNGLYRCIVNGLQNNVGAKEIAECDSLEKWGTRDGISKVLERGRISPPDISRETVKKVD
jgi:hypothetical protein